MYRNLALLFLLVVSLPSAAQGSVRYVSDELTVVLREGASVGSAARGSLNSGIRMELLESDSGTGFARVRLTDGREGWVQERFLTTTPIARERVDRAEKQLTQTQSELRILREEHAKLLSDFTRITSGLPPTPPEELVKEVETLRVRAQELQQQNDALQARHESTGERQRLLLIGGGLVVIGFLLALILRWLWPKRRWGEL